MAARAVEAPSLLTQTGCRGRRGRLSLLMEDQRDAQHDMIRKGTLEAPAVSELKRLEMAIGYPIKFLPTPCNLCKDDRRSRDAAYHSRCNKQEVRNRTHK